jgi:hypothetical protein
MQLLKWWLLFYYGKSLVGLVSLLLFITRNLLNTNGITDGIIMSVICGHNYRQHIFRL